MKSKTIIISSQNNSSTSGRGILTIYNDEDLLKCRLRLYNISKLNKYCKLGIYHNKEVYTANMLEKNNVYESSFVGEFDIDKDFYCAIIDTSKNNDVLLAGGTYSGYYFNDFSVFDNSKNDIQDETEECKEDDCNEDNDKCKNCKYKEYFYSSNLELNKTIKLNNTENETEQNKETNSHTILNSITPQFKYIFENYNLNEELTNLIPNSKFVKINENSEEYSIGAIYEDENIKLICYAIKCNYNTPPPEELGKHYQWLPLDKEDPLSEGYYMVFQDSNDLKILQL